jgi:hypothetical protein
MNFESRIDNYSSNMFGSLNCHQNASYKLLYNSCNFFLALCFFRQNILNEVLWASGKKLLILLSEKLSKN